MYWRRFVTGVEVAIASAAAISKVAISNGHCICTSRLSQWGAEGKMAEGALRGLPTRTLPDVTLHFYVRHSQICIFNNEMAILDPTPAWIWVPWSHSWCAGKLTSSLKQVNHHDSFAFQCIFLLKVSKLGLIRVVLLLYPPPTRPLGPLPDPYPIPRGYLIPTGQKIKYKSLLYYKNPKKVWISCDNESN